jgi:lipopolysaccharide heptosyltransferase II
MIENTGFPREEHQRVSSWRSSNPPKRVLIIRMHALGDVAITFPAIESFRNQYPDATIDFLTTAGPDSLVQSIESVNEVNTFPACATSLPRAIESVRFGLRLRRRHYDVVVDLQRNWVTRIIRVLCHPQAFGEFNRFAPKAAGERVLDTFHDSGFDTVDLSRFARVKSSLTSEGREILTANGWNGILPLVVLNPAGFWATRNWPVDNYAGLGELWLRDEHVQFLLLGTQRMREKATTLTQHFGHHAINLVGRTTPSEALACLQHASCIVSEDSGLMHMAWVSGIPTIALFGSSRHVWSTPLGPHTLCLHSGDLECGACMKPECVYGDVHCLTRFTPEFVYERARSLVKMHRTGASVH